MPAIIRARSDSDAGLREGRLAQAGDHAPPVLPVAVLDRADPDDRQ
jgi:hypothetical protein